VQFWVDEIIDSYYWKSTVTPEGLSGSVVSQTVLNSQGGWLTGVDLFLTRIASTGDVHVIIAECNEIGAPDFEKAIARSTVSADLLRVYPNPTHVGFLPTYLAKGKRYAIVVQTPGNHFTSIIVDNKFAQGSLFISTDGAWAAGDTRKDMPFRMYFAKFNTNRVVVQLQPLQLDLGIGTVDLNYDSTRPPGTTISFEVQKPDGKWVALGWTDGAFPLTGLIPMYGLRAILTGTTDEMPGIGVASNSRQYTERLRKTMCHISTARTMPVAKTVNTVYVDFKLEGWRGAGYHTFLPRLLTGASYITQRTPSLIEQEPNPEDPTTVFFRCTWNLAALGGTALTSYKIRCEGTTDNALAPFIVSERVDVAVFI
jgi:hypothetical protein